MPQKIKKLSPHLLDLHHRAIKRTIHVMNQYGLTQADVSALLGYSRTTITYWFQDKVRCPDNAPEMLRSLCETITPEYLERWKTRS